MQPQHTLNKEGEVGHEKYLGRASLGEGGEIGESN